MITKKDIFFSKDSYIYEIKNIYKKIFNNVILNNSDVSIYNFDKLEISKTWIIQDWHHKILALTEVLQNVLDSEDIYIIWFLNLLVWLNISFIEDSIDAWYELNDLERISINEIDEVTNPIIKHYLKNKFYDWEEITNKQLLDSL